MINESIKNTLNRLILKTEIIFFLYLVCLILISIIYSYAITKINPDLINDIGEYQINKIGFNFNEIINKIIVGETPKATYAGVDFYVSRMPLLPYFLYFITKYFTKNFIAIHLIKNLVFGSIIFFTIKSFKKNNIFLVICLTLIFYIPHNVVTMTSTNFEEGFLIYFLIILFFVLISEFKYKSLYCGIILSLIFFLKSSMFYLSLGMAIIYILVNKQKKYLPIIFIIISSSIWGSNSYYKTGKFAFGSSSTSLNGPSTQIVFHKDFTSNYPTFNPDMFWSQVWDDVEKKKFQNEWEINSYTLSKSINYIKNNPKDIIIGIYKKLYVIFLSPYKETIQKDDYVENKTKNKIRLSNIPNKIIFLISLLFLFKLLKNYKTTRKFELTVSIYYLSILILYFFPYISAFIFPRHCIAMYILAHLYLIVLLWEKFKINKNIIF